MASTNEYVDKIAVQGDSRVIRKTATLNGKAYGYLLAEPDAGFTRTIILIHGFPDLSMGWRYQIPHFLKLGFRVICPDCIGYGRSDAPKNSLDPYTFKSQAIDFHDLCKSLGCESAIVGAHDWGAMIAYRFALEFPSFVTHLFTYAVPYIAVSKTFVQMDTFIKLLPSITYQVQFGSEEGIVESHTQDKAGIRQYLNAMFFGQAPGGRLVFDPQQGLDFELLPDLHRSSLIDEDELEYYVGEYARTGLRGPCNYYRTRLANFVLDRPLLDVEDGVKIKCPTLFMRGLKDDTITDEIAGMMQSPNVPDLTLRGVDAGHWLLWEKPWEVNVLVEEWMRERGLIVTDC